MILCLDIGNTHIFGGFFSDDQLKLSFRYPTQNACSSDQFGLFVKSFLREHETDPGCVKAVILGSVVPSLDYSISSACVKYFGITPLVLRLGVRTGLKAKVKEPATVGADRIATAVGASELFPHQDLIICDFGTATTVGAVSKDKEFLGGVIMPGIRISMEALSSATAKLAPVEILKPAFALGKTTESNIQAGLYFGQLAAAREVIARLKEEAHFASDTKVIGTGGYAHLFEDEHLFSDNVPNLVLFGLLAILKKNL
ncbi:MAG: type III pantothenate kinase [Deltaproteobacteria bacterium]|nr:type III pantothenate kinase [Deltaproteobacteria bacterium]